MFVIWIDICLTQIKQFEYADTNYNINPQIVKKSIKFSTFQRKFSCNANFYSKNRLVDHVWRVQEFIGNDYEIFCHICKYVFCQEIYDFTERI